MQRRVLVVGNCLADHAALRRGLRRHFDVEVVRSLTPDDALELLHQEHFDLVLVNRTLHGEGGDGLELVRQIKTDRQLGATAVMLLSDHAEYQDQAVGAGALRGFGKKDISSPEVQARLSAVLF